MPIAHQITTHAAIDPVTHVEARARPGAGPCCGGDLVPGQAAHPGESRPGGLPRGGLPEAARRGDSWGDPRELSTPDLVDFIVARHHGYLREELPALGALAAVVSEAHGDRAPELRELRAALEELSGLMLAHLEREEAVLFPRLLAPGADRALLAQVSGQMTEEDRAQAALLGRIRALTDGFALPPWACAGHRALLAGLAQLEGDVFTHAHLEGHVLAPRFEAR